MWPGDVREKPGDVGDVYIDPIKYEGLIQAAEFQPI